MPEWEQPNMGNEFVTRREMYLTVQPLIDKQQELTEVMIGIGVDVKKMLALAARHEGSMEATQKAIDTRRFWYTIIAALTSGCVIVFAVAILHAL